MKPMILEWIRKTVARQNYVEQSHDELLREYVRTKESAVFAELVERLAPLVWGVCRRVLGDEHTSEDAFQATFLILARKAETIRSPERLPAWIYRVARHIANEFAKNQFDQPASLIGDIPDPSSTSLDRISAKELLQAVETEVDQLPEHYRTAVLVCWFQEVSLDTGAKQLGVSKGKLWGWLKRARQMLRTQLEKKGYGLPALLGSGLLVPSRVSARLIQDTVDRVSSGIDHRITSGMLVNFAGEVSHSFVRKGSLISISIVAMVGIAVTLISGANQSKEKTPKTDLAPQVVQSKPVSDGFPLPPGAEFRFGNLQMRAPDHVVQSALSPDGKYLASCGYRVLVIWDTKTLSAKQIIKDPRPIHYFPYMGYTGLQFTPDSKRLIVSNPIDDSARIGTKEETFAIAQIVDVESGKKVNEVKVSGPLHPYSAHWISSSGKEMITFNSGNSHYWNLREEKESQKVSLGELPTAPPWITNGVDRIAFVSQSNQKFKVFDTKTGKLLFSTNDHVVLQATFSPDGKTLVYQTSDSKMHICDLESKTETGSFIHPEKKECPPVPMRIGKDNRTLLFGSPNGILLRWDLKENKRLPNLGRHSTWTLSTLATNSEEKILYTMGWDRVIQRWDLAKEKKLPLPEWGYTNQLSMTLSTNGKRLFIGDHGNDGDLFEWDIPTGKRIQRWKAPQSWGVNCLASSPNGKWLASGTVTQEVQLWDLNLGKVTKSFPLVEKPNREGEDPIQRIEFSPDSQVLYTTSFDTGLSAYEINSQKLLWRVRAGNEFACSRDGKWIASTERLQPNQGTVPFHLLDPKSGNRVHSFEIPPQPRKEPPQSVLYPPWVSHFCIPPNNSMLISSHQDGWIRLWDPQTSREIRKWKIAQGNRIPIACSEDSRWLAVVWPDSKFRIYELATGKEILGLEGHESEIAQLLFTKDSRSLISNADLGPLKWTLRPSNLPTLPDSLDAIWEMLATEDSAKAYRLQWALIDRPEIAIRLGESKIEAKKFSNNRQQFDRWIRDLDSSRFSVREAAQKEILAQGELLPSRWLMEALQGSKTEEQKNRLQKLLELQPKAFSVDTLRIDRALYVLEQLNSPEAKKLLQKLAQVTDGNLLADRAKAALERCR